jgi:hypothetical protein
VLVKTFFYCHVLKSQITLQEINLHKQSFLFSILLLLQLNLPLKADDALKLLKINKNHHKYVSLECCKTNPSEIIFPKENIEKYICFFMQIYDFYPTFFM